MNLADYQPLIFICIFFFGLGMMFATWAVWRTTRYVPHVVFNLAILIIIFAVVGSGVLGIVFK